MSVDSRAVRGRLELEKAERSNVLGLKAKLVDDQTVSQQKTIPTGHETDIASLVTPSQ